MKIIDDAGKFEFSNKDDDKKPRLNSREVECIVRMHRGHTVPERLRSTKIALMTRGLVCCTYEGYSLAMPGKKIARHLTGVI